MNTGRYQYTNDSRTCKCVTVNVQRVDFYVYGGYAKCRHCGRLYEWCGPAGDFVPSDDPSDYDS